MSFQAAYYMPGDDTLCELGRVQVLHSHLDHALRLAIKRMLGISVDDPGYWNETRGMAATLRERTRKLIAEKYGDDEDTANTLNNVLDDAEATTELRNRAVHSVWMKATGHAPFLHDRDKVQKAHVNFPVPTTAELATISERLQRIQRVLGGLTRALPSPPG